MDKPVLLIVDDIEDNRLGLQDWLEDHYECMLAGDAEEAAEMLAGRVPHAILLDLSLPGMTGWEFAKQLKQDERYRDVPIIAVSAYARREDIDRAMEAGCDDYLTKPFRMTRLFELLDRHISRDGR